MMIRGTRVFECEAWRHERGAVTYLLAEIGEEELTGTRQPVLAIV